MAFFHFDCLSAHRLLRSLAREQRKLAAILAADVVGYSRLMGRDESGTLARLRKNRSEHLDPVLTKYGGRLVKLTRLFVSQPAISKAIADLENTLEVRLLDRGPLGVEPTLYGSALVRRGLAVFDELRQAVGEIEFMANPTEGEVRIGCNESLAAALLPAVIERLSNQHPGVTVHVSQMSRPITQEIQQLRERNVDLIIGRGIFPIPEDDLNAEILFNDRLVVAVGMSHQLPRTNRNKDAVCCSA